MVAPFVGAWIEMLLPRLYNNYFIVAPFVGAWIEIGCYIHGGRNTAPSLPLWERGLKSAMTGQDAATKKSLPLWERGLKFRFRLVLIYSTQVAPFVGAWIEMCLEVESMGLLNVAPFVGAWIEIRKRQYDNQGSGSLPLWERGLK